MLSETLKYLTVTLLLCSSTIWSQKGLKLEFATFYTECGGAEASYGSNSTATIQLYLKSKSGMSIDSIECVLGMFKTNYQEYSKRIVFTLQSDYTGHDGEVSIEFNTKSYTSIPKITQPSNAREQLTNVSMIYYHYKGKNQKLLINHYDYAYSIAHP